MKPSKSLALSLSGAIFVQQCHKYLNESLTLLLHHRLFKVLSKDQRYSFNNVYISILYTKLLSNLCHYLLFN